MKTLAYFPGCSLVTLAREAHEALLEAAPRLGWHLQELTDWNCCGGSSAHSLSRKLAHRLAWRILSLVPEGQDTLLVMCPSCRLRLMEGLRALESEEARRDCTALFGRLPGEGIEVRHLLELLAGLDASALPGKALAGWRIAPYYGCLLFAPPAARSPRLRFGVLEDFLSSLGAEVVTWRFASQCCGTYLSVVRPDLVSRIVSDMMHDARARGAEALVTPCVMCQMNLEMRTQVDRPLPVFHLTEILALASGKARKSWFRRHLVDPLPLLREKGLLP